MACASVPVSKCGICLEILRDHCSLPCKHLFCKECLESWIWDSRNTTDSLVCPVCKKVTPNPFEAGRPFNTVVQIDMAEKDQDDFAQKKCSKCANQSSKPSMYCQNCTAYLCATCFDSHEAWFKQHVTVTMEDLASGKVHITKMEDQMCTKHEGEQNRFYCVTCQQLVCRDCILMKQHCRDHDYVTLKEAAEEKLSTLKQVMEECDNKRKECQRVSLKIQSASTQLVSDSNKVKVGLKKSKMDYLKQVETFYDKMDDAVDKLKNIYDTTLQTSGKSVKDMLQEIENASTKGRSLVESGSHYNILANSKSVLETLQQVNQMTLNKIDVSSVKFPTSVSMAELNQTWKQIGGFKVDCEIYPTGIAVTSDGKVAVCDTWHCVKVLSQSGDLLHTFDGTLGGLGDIFVTPDDTYIYPLERNSAIKHKNNYHIISEFKTVNANKNPSEARTVTVDKDGFMIFGMNDNTISIHNPDGSLKCSFTIPYTPRSVAVTSYAEVVVASYNNDIVQLFDYSGNCLHTLGPPDEVTSWTPLGVCCSTTDEVFVVNRGRPKAIYKYIAGRVCMGCVTREVDEPWGIALSHDDKKLYVTEKDMKMVKIFQRP